MSDQSIFTPTKAKPTELMIQAPKAIHHLKHVAKSRRNIPVRFPIQLQKEYQTALFQAAALGDIQTLHALTHKETETLGLVDQQSCDNALWVSAAEHHHLFALALLKRPALRSKISTSGAKAAMKMAVENTQDQEDYQDDSHQKALIKALLEFIKESDTASSPKNRQAQKSHLTTSLENAIEFEYNISLQSSFSQEKQPRLDS